jgi:hypothetical protein
MLEHLSVFSWNGIYVIKKITSMPFHENTRRTQEDAITFIRD